MNNKMTGYFFMLTLTFGLIFQSGIALAIDVNSTIVALRMANSITGGAMPSSDPLFQQMVVRIQKGDLKGAASIAANSSYFANYLGRRLALQMQNPSLDASTSADNDSTAFIIAHFIGAGGTKPQLSTLLTDNATYMVSTSSGLQHVGDPTAVSPSQLMTMNWKAALVRSPGQKARSMASTDAPMVAINQSDVGGFVTLSANAGDHSFAQFGATAGTNLRMIEGIWEVLTGIGLVEGEYNYLDANSVYVAPNSPLNVTLYSDTTADAVAARDMVATQAPIFLPEYNHNFYHGYDQTACTSCHVGGLSAATHGYAAVADTYDFDPAAGLVYHSAMPDSTLRKSLGSNPDLRVQNLACDVVANPSLVCNSVAANSQSSADLYAGRKWDLELWGESGLLSKMGWNAVTHGAGLNQLGDAIGHSNVVYEFMTKRVINEICPMGNFSAEDVVSIGAAANPYASPAGTDDVRTIVALVASNGSCL